MSDFARKRHFSFIINSKASSKLANLTFASESGMLELTEVPSYGADKLCSSLNLLELAFCLRARGEITMSHNGGLGKGPAIIPSSISKLIFSKAASGLFRTDREFFDTIDLDSP